ncbi:MarR family winged helix-turn-helix transcriptional regulator [Sabulicella rubraurantiaca]|uniref:MarR family winged helix-turn-helix transcriptional regulator n=1 Tax=Sabulicella rubraurantiaca TaxID=2811429 RepID=UPI001A957678|nr:MarR family winged helix-turn-helix transcriptional regulator [Sabulicella rubraurantiaca]
MDERLPQPDLCNCLAIRKAARHVTQYYDGHLAPTGLRTTQFSILARLKRLGPSTINELAADLVMDRTTLGRNLGPLERDGLVAVGVDPRDRRNRILDVTETGAERLAEARKRWTDAQHEFDAAFGGPQAAALRQTLAVLVNTELRTPEASEP